MVSWIAAKTFRAETLAFIFLLPLGGIVSESGPALGLRGKNLTPGIPAIGYLLDARPMKDIVLIMGVMSTAFGIFGMIRNTVAQLVGIAILTVFRPLYYTAISCVLFPFPCLLGSLSNFVGITAQRSLGRSCQVQHLPL